MHIVGTFVGSVRHQTREACYGCRRPFYTCKMTQMNNFMNKIFLFYFCVPWKNQVSKFLQEFLSY